MGTIKSYKKVGTPTVATDFPVYPNTLWEIDQTLGRFLAMIDPIPDYIQSSDDKGITWSNEVTGTAGAIIAAESWHDRANELLYVVETDTVNNGETYVVDYSTWAAIAITKHNGDLGAVVGGPHFCDIFLRDGNLETLISNGAQIDARRYNNPWASIDTNADNVTFISCVVVVGTVAYFYGDIPGANTIGMYKFDGATIDTLDTIAATSYSPINVGKNMAYDGNDLIYFIAVDDGTGDRYLYSYSITGDVITKHGVSTFFLMRDRDTAPGIKEKAWDWAVNGLTVYQLHEVIPFQLHKIAKPDITVDYKIYCVTDNFLWATKLNGAMASEIWERVDVLDYSTRCEIDFANMEAPSALVIIDSAGFPITKGMFITIRDTFLTANTPILYRGTYNFKDEADGTLGTDIDFVDSITTAAKCVIISDHNGHRKVLQITANNAVANLATNLFASAQTSGTIEFYFETSDASNYAYMILFDTTTQAILIRMNAANLQYRDLSAVWHTIKVIVADTKYHIRIDFDCATDRFDCYIDKDKLVTAGEFRNVVTNVDRFTIGCFDDDKITYWDAIGYSWDTDYAIGDNLRVEAEEKIIFEGFVEDFSDRRMSVVTLASPANKDLHTEFPEGDYSGRTDEIIVDLIGEYFDYITVGTLSAGTVMGTITFGGEKSAKEILDEFSLIDGFVWYLTPTGLLFYNNGTVDSLEDFTAASAIHNVDKAFAERAINRVDVKGGFVNSVQVSGTIAEDVPAQQLVGINPYEDVHSHLNTNALCTTVNTAILARYGLQPLIVQFSHRDSTVGLIQPGETITFEYNLIDPNIASDQFGIRAVVYDVLLGIARYRISDVII